MKSDLGKKVVAVVAVFVLTSIILVVLLGRIVIDRKRKNRNLNGEEIRKIQLSQRSLSHSDDDKNPDLIPQSTGT